MICSLSDLLPKSFLYLKISFLSDLHFTSQVLVMHSRKPRLCLSLNAMYIRTLESVSWANGKALMKLSHSLTNGLFFSLSPCVYAHFSVIKCKSSPNKFISCLTSYLILWQSLDIFPHFPHLNVGSKINVESTSHN